MEKFHLLIEILKILIKANRSLETRELHSELVKAGLFSNCEDRVERRKLLRALSTLESLGYVEAVESKGRKPFSWKLNAEKFRFLTSYTSDELISVAVLFSFFPRHYRHLPFFQKAFNVVERFERELSEEERGLLRFSFERIPIPNERFIRLNPSVVEKLIGAILENRKVYFNYRGKPFRVFPVKFFTYNGLFYLGALDNNIYRNFLVSRIESVELLAERISLEEKKRLVRETFKIPDEEPFLFGALLPESYATKKEIDNGLRFFPTQFHSRFTDRGIEVFLIGFTGKRFVSWFLVEKVLALIPPSRELIKMAQHFNLKEREPRLSFSLRVNEERFKRFKEKGLEILKLRMSVFND